MTENDNHCGCFGMYNTYDKICRYNCSLSIRCSIQFERILITEDDYDYELEELSEDVQH